MWEACWPLRVAEFRKASHPALHPGRTADVLLDGVVIQRAGRIVSAVGAKYDLPAAPVLFELDFAALLARQLVAAQPVSRLQPVRRDFALWWTKAQRPALLAAFEALNLPAVTGIGPLTSIAARSGRRQKEPCFQGVNAGYCENADRR